MRQRQKIKHLIAIATVFAGCLLIFQNCGKVSIASKAIPVEPPEILVSPKASGSVCSPSGATFGSPIRVSIILDMSFSNIGTLMDQQDYPNPVYWSKDTTSATDLSGQRLLQIRNFIDQCGSSANVDYAIMGFAANAMLPPENSCISPFESQSKALLSVDFLKGKQDSDNSITGGYGPSPFYLQGGTSYDAALSCLEQKINEDMSRNLAVEKPSYYAMMLTDGMPEEYTAGITVQMYKDKIIRIKTAIDQSATSFHFLPIYYGSSEQAPTAKATLDQLAQVVDPAQTSLDLSGANLSQIKTKLCEQLKPDSIIQYELKTLYAVNMNVVMKKNVLYADSDADGLTDEEETALGGAGAGFDPIDSHTSGILDSICNSRGLDKVNCAKLVTPLCSAKPAALGLRGCDLSAASTLFGLMLTGIDSDIDLIPDYLEILRSTSPSRADMLSSRMGDGKSNFEKITQGFDVESNRNLWPALETDLVKVSYRQDSATSACGAAKTNYQYGVEQIPLKPVPEYKDKSPSGPVDFSHGKDEYVVLIFSIWQASGGLIMPDRLYVQKILVPLQGEVQYVDKEPKLVGEIAL